jgi:putative restriction endonuclease
MIVGASAQATLPASPERRYALREIKARLHQASFRDAVLSAYGGCCAISHLPEPRLLDAAHIVTDADEQLGQPIVSNGLPLTKIHHAAFDAHLIGIDPDFRIHVSDRLLDLHDGPFLELGLKGIVGRSATQLSKGKRRPPDPDRGHRPGAEPKPERHAAGRACPVYAARQAGPVAQGINLSGPHILGCAAI